MIIRDLRKTIHINKCFLIFIIDTIITKINYESNGSIITTKTPSLYHIMIVTNREAAKYFLIEVDVIVIQIIMHVQYF